MNDSILGTWQVELSTPIGRLEVGYEFSGTHDAPIGTATDRDETVPLRDIVATESDEGRRVTWSQSIRKPLRLNLDFDVVISGDTMTGSSKAGRLPRSKVRGIRSE